VNVSPTEFCSSRPRTRLKIPDTIRLFPFVQQTLGSFRNSLLPFPAVGSFRNFLMDNRRPLGSFRNPQWTIGGRKPALITAPPGSCAVPSCSLYSVVKERDSPESAPSYTVTLANRPYGLFWIPGKVLETLAAFLFLLSCERATAKVGLVRL